MDKHEPFGGLSVCSCLILSIVGILLPYGGVLSDEEAVSVDD